MDAADAIGGAVIVCLMRNSEEDGIDARDQRATLTVSGEVLEHSAGLFKEVNCKHKYSSVRTRLV
jgi:hypothetical protein